MSVEVERQNDRHLREARIYRRIAFVWMVVLMCFGVAQLLGMRF